LLTHILVIIHPNLDFDNYDQPVQKFLDDRFTFYLIPDYAITGKVYIRENTAETQDGFFYYTPDGTETSFINFETVQNFLEPLTSVNTVYFCILIDNF
jgi:hypothetical protein